MPIITDLKIHELDQNKIRKQMKWTAVYFYHQLAKECRIEIILKNIFRFN
jgi:hypothetical protein